MNNVLIVTATQVESKAVLELFPAASGTPWQREHTAGKTYYNLGEIGGVHVWLVQAEMGAVGPGATVLTVRDAIDAYSPVAVIMVGIAFGMNPAKQQLGDILVSRQIMAYEPQKVGRKRTPRGDRVPATPSLLDMFRSGDMDWQGAKVRIGLVLSGEKLVNNLTFRKRLLTIEPEAIGGEMEGAGLYAVAYQYRVPWILVKAICDWADGTKNDEAQSLAARNAAEYALHVIGHGGLASLSPAGVKPAEMTDRPPADSMPGAGKKDERAPAAGQRIVNTGGGNYIEGSLTVAGDIVAGNKITYQSSANSPAAGREPSIWEGFGAVPADLRHPEQAIETYAKGLYAATTALNRRGQAANLAAIGAAHNLMRQWEQAIESFQSVLPIWRQLGDRRGESLTLQNLGDSYSGLGQSALAAEYYVQAAAVRDDPGKAR